MSCRDRFNPQLCPSIESLIVRNWLKHSLPTNSIVQSPADEKQNAIGWQKIFHTIAYDQWLYRGREWRTKMISARHFCSRSVMSASRKWTRKPKKRSNLSLWADLLGKFCDKKFISTLHKNNSFVQRLQNFKLHQVIWSIWSMTPILQLTQFSTKKIWKKIQINK